MLRYCTFSSRYTTTWCYATARSLQVIQLRDATFTSSSFALAHSCHATLRSLGAVGGVLASSFFDLKIFTQGVVFYMHLMLNSTHMCHLNMVSLQVSQVSMFIMHYANTFTGGCSAFSWPRCHPQRGEDLFQHLAALKFGMGRMFFFEIKKKGNR